MGMNRKTDSRGEVRSASSHDAGAIVELINAHARHYCGEGRIGLQEVLTWFKSPDAQQDDTRSWWKDDALIAYAQVYMPEFPASWDVIHDVTVHPSETHDDDLWADILAWCDDYQWVARRQPDKIDVGLRSGARILEGDKEKRKKYESRGYGRVRSETLMRVGLSEVVAERANVPNDIRIRQLNLKTDLEGYALAYGEAFQDHWGHRDLPHDERIQRKKSEFEALGDMYVPDLWHVALDGDTIVGSVGSFLNYGNVTGRCYLYHVFVRDGWRNRRIATTLMRTAFGALKERGGRTVELHVDSENVTYGLELYRGLGMKPVWHQGLYERVVPTSERRS